MSEHLDEKNRPDTRNQASKSMLGDTTLMRDVYAGTSHMRNRRTEYLPSHPKEKGPDYARRLAMAVLSNFLQRTITGLSGMVFRRNITLGDDVPKAIATHAENIDNAGSHIDVFARELFDSALLVGHMGVLVDVPAVESGGRRLSGGEETALGIRPYWVMVPKENIISWRTTVERGVVILSQLVLYEPTLEPDGDFGEAVSERYRVLRRDDNQVVTAQVFEIIDDKAIPLDEPRVITNQTEIPFSICFGAARTGLVESRPALLDLAHLNIAHYQDAADHRYARHLGNVPILTISGVDTDEELTVAPNTALKLPSDQAKAYYTEPSGNAYAANKEALNEYKADIAALGLAMLQRETRAAETYGAKKLDAATEQSALAVAARSLKDCLERAVAFHANFMRLPEGGSVDVNMDFDNEPMTPEELREKRAMVQEGSLSLDTLWEEMKYRGNLPDTFDAEIERDRIEDDSAIRLERTAEMVKASTLPENEDDKEAV